mmetsp:Transcript_3593/g.10210  ORF Transcript_3593/g.10210 Transcript_3593/m.10210 type:complete len:1064 (+) Transcript_3593:243-3434(+)
MLRVTPLYGSHGHNPASASLSIPPSSTLVEYGGVRVLVNVGWDESYPLLDGPAAAAAASSGAGSEGKGGANQIPPASLPDVDAIVITDSTLTSLGGLPIYLGRRGRARRAAAAAVAAAATATATGASTAAGGGREGKADLPPIPPIYGTYPTLKMGQMTLYDYHATQCLDGRDPGFDLADVDELFAEGRTFRPLKYSQTLNLPLPVVTAEAGPKRGGTAAAAAAAAAVAQLPPLLGITPHRAGHVTGGAFYVLRRLSDETEVVVAPGHAYHHAKERHLDGATLHKFGAAADVLITSPGGSGGLLGSLYRPPSSGGGRAVLTNSTVSRRETELVELVMAALRRGGNVLLPVDASGRVLELLLVLGRHWERQRLGSAYNLVWVGSMTWNTIEFARSQLEWMAAPLGAQFDSQRGHPYALKAFNICSSLSEFDAIVEASNGNPTVALASGASLDSGPARDLLLRWSENQDNAIILTDSSRCVPRGDVGAARVLGLTGPGQKVGGVGQVAAGAVAGEAVEAEEEAGEVAAALVGSAVLAADVSSQSTAAQLLTKWCESKAAREEMADIVDVDVPVPHRSPLAGLELQAFLAEEEKARKRKQAEKERKAMLAEVEKAKESLHLGDDDAGGVSTAAVSSDKSAGASTRIAGTKAKGGAVATKRPRKKSRFDQNLFLKFSKPLHMTFTVRDETVGIGQADLVATSFGIADTAKANVVEDDYGIAVEPERFVDIVTGIDPSKGSGRIADQAKGLGFGSDGRPLLSSSAMVSSSEDGAGPDNADAADDEQALEAADLSEGRGIIRGRNGRPPIKVTALPRKIELLAEVAYVSLEGRVDARAARQSIRALQPRQVVILGGGKPKIAGALCQDASSEAAVSEVSLLSDAVKSLSVNKDSHPVFAPSDNETAELNVGHAAYSVRLVDTPYRNQEERDAAAVAGEDLDKEALPDPFEAKMGECTVSLVENVATGQRVAADGSIVLAPSVSLADGSRHQPSVMISDGDVLLTDLRAELISQGMKAEYSTRAGYAQLIVNERVVVRKDQATGKIDVEGPLCQDFFSIRSVVCGQYVTL